MSILTIDSSFYKDYLTPSFSILPNIVTNNTDPPSSIIYTYSSTNPIVADVVDGIVTIGNVGNTILTITQLATENFEEVNTNTMIYVSRILPTINYESLIYNKTYKDEPFQLNATTTNTDNNLLLYSTTNSIVANVDDVGTVTIGNVGTANITLTNPQTENYYEVSSEIVVNVASLQSNIIVDSSFTRIYLDSSFNLTTVTNNPETPIQYTSVNTTIATVDQYGNVIIGNAGNTRIELYQPNTTNYSTVTANTIIYVNKRQANIIAEPSFTQIYGNLTLFNINASKTNEETDIQYTSLNPTVATVDSYGNVNATNTGNTIITMYQPETTNYLTVSSNTVVYINKAVRNLTIDSSFTQIYGNHESYMLNPIANNYDSPIQYTSLNPVVANVDSIGNVTFGNAGTALILLTQAETDNFLPVTANITIYVNRAIPTLTIDASFSRNYLSPSFSIIPNIATNNSDPLSSNTYTYNSVNPSIATAISGIVTIGNVGNTIMTVTQSATPNFAEVTANTTIYVSRIFPNINYTSFYNKTYKDSIFQLNASTTNTDNRQLLYSTSNSIVANVDAFGNVTIGNTGRANITLVKSQTANFYEVSSNILINVARLRSNITVNPSFTRNYLDPPFNLTTATNNTETSIQYTSLDQNVALVDAYGNITLGNSGNTKIRIYLPSTVNFSSITAYTNIYVNKRASSVIVAPIFYKTYGNTSVFNINASYTNPETNIQYTSLNTSVATVNSYGNIVTGNAGNAIIQVYVPETTNYKSASTTTVIRVNKLQPYLIINSSFTRVYNSSPFDLRPNISTDNTDSTRILQYTTSDSGIATVVDGIVTIQSVGTTTITITQLQSTNFLEASTTTVIYILKKQSIITVSPSFTTTYGNEPFAMNETTNNDEMPLLYFSSNPSVATINNNGIITIKGIGRTTITIAQEISANFSSVYVTTIIYVNPKPPYIIPAGTSISNQFAYGVRSGTYTVKDKSAYPVKCTPVFSKITGQVKPCPSNSTL
jgi:hypothetical protein